MVDALLVRKVTKSYRLPGGRRLYALVDVSLSVRAGEFVAVVGPNGSGKSTLLKVAAGLLKPDSGDVLLLGLPLYKARKNRREAMRKTGYLSQEDLLVDTLSVLENVELPLMLDGLGGRERRELALEALRRVGAEKLADRKPWELSGGERRLVSLARSLIRSPSVLLLDEPTGGLDRETAKRVVELLSSLASSGSAALVSTHDPLVAEASSRILELRGGRLAES